jgi:integrase/recombinase XerD
MQQYLKDFLFYIASEKGLSKNTIEAYCRDCQSFLDFLALQNMTDLTQIQQGQIIDFLSQLKDQNYATSSISRALMSLKVFFRFLKREQILTNDIAFTIESPRLWQLIPEVLSYREVELLLAQPNSNTAVGSRDKAILEILYASGLRVSEVCSLGLYDVDDSFIRVMGKGSKERIVPIGKKAIEALDHYLLHYRGVMTNEQRQPLFISRFGRPIDRLSIWKMIKKYGRQAGIVKNISPHTLRHSFATHLLDNGADLRIIQEMLGHSHISSTDRYTHVSQSHIQKAFQKFHPKGL